MDHNKNPRNFYEMPDADLTLEGFNPLCGDRVKLFLKLNGDVIEKVSFVGEGCAISQASASMMTEVITGKTKQQALELFDKFHDLVTGKLDEETAMEELGKLVLLAGVKDLPSRVKCATISWHTLKNLIEGKTDDIIM